MPDLIDIRFIDNQTISCQCKNNSDFLMLDYNLEEVNRFKGGNSITHRSIFFLI